MVIDRKCRQCSLSGRLEIDDGGSLFIATNNLEYDPIPENQLLTFNLNDDELTNYFEGTIPSDYDELSIRIDDQIAYLCIPYYSSSLLVGNSVYVERYGPNGILLIDWDLNSNQLVGSKNIISLCPTQSNTVSDRVSDHLYDVNSHNKVFSFSTHGPICINDILYPYQSELYYFITRL